MRSKLRSNFLSSYLANSEESEEKDHGNEFRGSKNGGKGVWVGLGWPENGQMAGILKTAAADFERPIPARPPAAWPEIWPAESPGGGGPTCQARGPRRWPETVKMA